MSTYFLAGATLAFWSMILWDYWRVTHCKCHFCTAWERDRALV